ncbi:MAG: flippase-like domain-containing protein [Candidatus Fermentibacteraceae bacterium]|nr:flippase-like domain-containing protein [Candidatus Fermentibacteraceae bacterium]MBN2608354.1 flippase-like domain-containing protein [Candidatus Fermentibacteraceae bacterium]
MTADRRRFFHLLTTWGGVILLLFAIAYFALVAWPKWEPELHRFWEDSRDSASLPMIILSFLSLLTGYYFAPAPWRKILDALKVPRLDKGEVRRNWYMTQMGQYIPGKLWMVVGRITFLRANGIGPVKAITAFILENIYMMVALTIMAIVALPFLGMANVPLPVVMALWISALLGILMLFAPRIQKFLAFRLSRRLNMDIDSLPHISHKHQAVFIGYHLLSWTLRSMALYLWFRGFGVQPAHPFAMIAVCLLAGPVSWFIALVMVFIPGGIGIREGVQGLLLSGFAGGVQVATVIALGQRLLLMLVEGLYALQGIVYGALRRKYPKIMNHIEQVFHLAGSVIRSKLAMYGISKAPNPINVTFSVTRRCQSRCKTCFIWEHDSCDDMDLRTIERLFRSIGWTYFFNVSGGEPFLRDDLPEIIALACRFMTPAVIHIPTNAIAVDRVINMTVAILKVIDREAPGSVLTIKPSFDGIGELHDEIRGVPGNFQRLLETLERLRELQSRHDNLHVGVGTVISRFNADRLNEIIEYSKGLGVDSYINEIAEEREEFFNIGSGITPDGDSYGRIMEVFKKSVLEKMKDMKLLPRITTALRVVYYDLVVRILNEQRQVIPCSAGLMNVHINSDGGIWPCAVLAYNGQMGKVDENTDFREIWNSKEAKKIRKSIRRRECHCPLANQAYSNILLHPRSLFKAIWIAFRGRT